MRRMMRFCSTAAVLAPIAAGTPRSQPDSAATEICIAGGGGSYVDIARGCNGDVLSKERHRDADLSLSIDHRVQNRVTIGLRAGTIWDDAAPGNDANSYLNARIAFDWRYAGVGVGGVLSQRDFPGVFRSRSRNSLSGHLRLGKQSGYHFAASWFEQESLSGAGYGAALLYLPPFEHADVWFGASLGGPFDSGGALVGAAWKVAPGIRFTLNARIGDAEGSNEYGGSFGVHYGGRRE